jgi:hypothetical protein
MDCLRASGLPQEASEEAWPAVAGHHVMFFHDASDASINIIDVL